MVVLDFLQQMNGTRFLFWTWHDTSRKLENRIFKVPVSHLLSESVFAAAYSLLCEFIFSGESIFQGIKGQLKFLAEDHQEILVGFARFV